MDEEEEFVKGSHQPKRLNEKDAHLNNRSSILVNLCVYSSFTFFLTIIFMYTLAKRTREPLLPSHSSQNKQQLQCPQGSSFSGLEIACIECPQDCLECLHFTESKCLQCSNNLNGTNCVTQCDNNFERVCNNDESFELRRVKTELPVEQDLFLGIWHANSSDWVIALPPMGETFTFYNVSLFKELNASICVPSTALEHIFSIEQTDELDSSQEQFIYLTNIVQSLNLKNATQIRVVAIYDMVFFAHKLSHLIVKQDLCIDCTITVILLQTKTIPLLYEIPITEKHSKLIAYTQKLTDVPHNHNSKSLPIEETTYDFEQELKRFLSFEKLFFPTLNLQIDVSIYSEEGCPDLQPKYKDFKAHSFKQLQVPLEYEETQKLNYLIREILRE